MSWKAVFAVCITSCMIYAFAPLGFAFNEAPVFADKVKAGELPAVAQRLPSAPVVTPVFDRTGQYGGVWRRAYTGLSDLVGARRLLYDPLVRWSPNYMIIPNLAKSWEVGPEGRVFTFHLVEGVKWSDGAPFTAEDILFVFDDILFNTELTPSVPSWLTSAGIPPKVTKLDDFTIRIEFQKPYSLFLQQLACPQGMTLVTRPKHYLKQFHKKYAKPEELEKLVSKRRISSWVKLFQDMSDIQHSLFMNPELPSICAWTTRVPAPAKRFIMERNPYYWKVDSAGNQLPYIDTIVHDLQAEAQTILLKAVAGEIDMQGRRLGGMQASVLLMANLPQGKYKLVPKESTASVGLLLAPNLNHKDPTMRAILGDPRFRKALSHAINRIEINKIVYRGRGLPRQAAPLKESEFYSESYANAYTEYSPAKAKTLLDEMGLKANSSGRRMRPDGAPLQLSLDVNVSNQSNVDTAEIVASNLKSVGIDAEVKSEAMDLFHQRTRNVLHDIALWSGDGGIECLLEPRWYFPFSAESLQAPLWAAWYQSGGESGEEPPAEIKEIMETYNRILTTMDDQERKNLFQKIIDANEKNLYVIGLVHDPPDFYVVAPHMFNLPKKDFQSWIYPNPGPIHPEQFFYDQSVAR